MLRPGDRLPHFSVTSVGGHRVDYATIWQRKILVLVSLPAEESTPFVDLSEFVAVMRGASQLASSGVERPDAECLITRDRVDR